MVTLADIQKLQEAQDLEREAEQNIRWALRERRHQRPYEAFKHEVVADSLTLCAAQMRRNLQLA